VEDLGDLLLALADRTRPTVGVPSLLCEEAVERLEIDGAALVVMASSPASAASRALVGAAGLGTVALDDAQLVTGEGPCAESHETGRLILVDDLRDQHRRWPAFTERAAGLGVRAVFTFPVQIGGIRLGVLELHRHTAGALSDDELSLALRFVDAASYVLLHGSGAQPWAAVDPGLLDGAVAEVHQATGMVAVQASVPLADALLVMRGRAFAQGTSLREVASDVVTRSIRFEPAT